MPDTHRVQSSGDEPSRHRCPVREQPARIEIGESSPGPGDRRRGQTTLDFAIGVAIFLSAMMFAFSFAPGILTPFTESGEQDTVTVDRVANHVGQSVLGNPSEPYVLDRRCTVAFFDGDPPPSGCQWESGDLNERLGVGEFANVNVTITGNVTDDPGSSVVHWDEDEGTFTEVEGDGEVALTLGETPPPRNDATVTASRVASLHTHDVTISVVMW